MVDFKKLAEEAYARMTPEEKGRVDAYRSREAEANATAISIMAKFERTGYQPVKPKGIVLRRPGEKVKEPQEELVVLKSWESEVVMRIEAREGRNGERVEILAFKNAVTGYESFTLDEHLCEMLVDPKERERMSDEWYICAGGMGWDSCRVKIQDIEDYIRVQRPHLFENAEATQSFSA